MNRKLDESRLLYAASRDEWRRWLESHYKTEKEIWLVFYKKSSGQQRIPYNDAVEEALSFGWIDSTVRSLDEEKYAQRFSPRNPKTPYSQANKERLKGLIKQGRVAPEVLASLPDLEEEKFEVAPDILKAIRNNEDAWRNFQAFSPPYIRIRIGFIEGARNRPEEFRKRLKYFIEMAEKNKQFGYGGIEKYY